MKVTTESIITLEFFGQNNLSYKFVIPYNCPLVDVNSALETFKRQVYKWEEEAIANQKKLESSAAQESENLIEASDQEVTQ